MTTAPAVIAGAVLAFRDDSIFNTRMMTRALGSAFVAALVTLAASPAVADDPPLYKVVDGYKVDAETLKGFRTWRAAACDRCHGANQEGLVGPSLVNSLKTLTKAEFIKTVRDGRLDKGMQSFGTSQQVMDNIDHLYAYLKGRSDGAITRAKVEPIQ
jgi:mono/diheme cytochrome c family protein